MHRQVNAIAGRLSLRHPQRRSLEILDRITGLATLKKGEDPTVALDAIKAEWPTVTDFEREFPSVCFALATGVGKTRLMGAFVTYLHLAHGARNFFILAPNLTIYSKLIADFTPNTPKYVFKGIAEFAAEPPQVITGDNYDATLLNQLSPFVLVIARDTTHAAELDALIKSDAFFDGRYKDRVIQVDSSRTGAEEEAMVERLLRVEKADEPTEIVIHVNMLKEGWDVTNLYTIVPLRAANARTLVEQSIGRGLRLPYGERVGLTAVDRLNIVAHDRFQEIVDDANRPDSPLRVQAVVTSLVEEIVRLHAAVPTEAIEIADGAQAVPPTVDRAVTRTSVPEPIVSFQSRCRALELIQRGNLLGAWAVAEPLHVNEEEHRWTEIIEWLACFAASLPMPGGCDLAAIKHNRMAVRAAIRVELALRAGDIPRAVHGTVAFFETALWDHLSERTSRHQTERKYSFYMPPPSDLVRERDETKLAALSKNKQKENDNRPFIPKDMSNGTQWYWIDDKEAPATKLAEHYLKLDGLTKLAKAVDRDIRTLRNDASHNEPTPELMNDARRQMRAAQLWSDTDTFLSQPVVQAVLQELGVDQPTKLLDSLLAEVRQRIVTLGFVGAMA